MKYTAEIQHTKDTIHKLSRTQHHAFRFYVRLVWSGCGMACIWGAVNTADQFLFYILIFAGIWLLLNLELPAKHQADKIIKAGNGVLPHTVYRFEEEKLHISSMGYEKNIAYTQLYALLEDKSYFYLFVNQNAGFMVDKKMIRPGEPSELKAFLENKCGIKFRKPVPLWGMLPAFSRKGGNRLGKP